MPKNKNQRKHAVCPNCEHSFVEGAVDYFCPNCGQRNINKTTSLGELFGDFIGNYLSLDSKLIRTIPRLLFFPGFLTNAFIGGKRIAYLSPVRIYLVMSLLYFSIFVSQFDFSGENITTEGGSVANVDSVLNSMPSAVTKDLTTKDEGVIQWNFSGEEKEILKQNVVRIGAFSKKYGIDKTMDSLKNENSVFVQNVLFEKVTTQGLRIYNRGPEKLSAYFFSHLPLMMLLSIPFFAFIFKILYIRQKRFYIEHILFLLHFHAFLYTILTFLLLGGEWLSKGYFAILILLIFVYFFIAIRKVYQQGWFKTLFKGFVFNLLYPVSLVVVILVTGVLAFMMF